MMRFPLLLLSILAASGLALGAAAKEGNKPPAGASPAQFGDQPGLNGQDMNVRPVDRESHISGDVQEGTGIRHRQHPTRTGQSPVAGHVQEGSSVRAPRDRPRRRRR